MSIFPASFHRRIAKYSQGFTLPQPVSGSIISFGFDDCPRSVVENALPQIEAYDWRATLYIACGLCESTNHLGLHMSLADIADAHKKGHEIADHTFSHLAANEVDLPTYLADIDRNQAALKAIGVPPSQNFAYPYGDVSLAVKKALKGRFTTARGVNFSQSLKQDATLLPAMRLYSGETIDAIIEQIKNSADTPQWINLFGHDVRDNPSEYGCTPEDLARVLSAIKQSGVKVMTVRDAYNSLWATERQVA